MKLALLAVLVASVSLLAGCGRADDEDSLARRAGEGLIEAGASPALARCLTTGLEDRLTEADAEAAYDDLASQPEVSEASLNRYSLEVRPVREHLASRAPRCRSLLVSSGRHTRKEVDRLLRRIGAGG